MRTESLDSYLEKARVSETVDARDAELAWINQQIQEIGAERLNNLVEEAVRIRENAYAPYSNYQVGAAMLSVSGNSYAACNNESVAYSETKHAESNAISLAIKSGEFVKSGRRFLKALVVSHSENSFPCGSCRQSMVEHADNALIIAVDGEGNLKGITSLKSLLPGPFTPTHLGIE